MRTNNYTKTNKETPRTNYGEILFLAVEGRYDAFNPLFHTRNAPRSLLNELSTTKTETREQIGGGGGGGGLRLFLSPKYFGG